MKTSAGDGLNIAQRYLINNESTLFAPLKRKYGNIDFQDIRQIVLLELGKKSDAYWTNVDNIPGAIYDRAEKRCIDDVRKVETRKEVADGLLLDQVPGKLGINPFDVIYAAIIVDELTKASPKEDQELIEYLLKGYEGPEIGARFTISHDAARARVSRLLKKLRKILNGSDKDPP